MAHDIQLPCDGDGYCMKCKTKPSPEETLTCGTCATPWHVTCLISCPSTLGSVVAWQCPDCSDLSPAAVEATGLVAAVREIERDARLTEKEKARKRQELVMGGRKMGEEEEKGKKGNGNVDVLDVLDVGFKCSFCMQLPERPVTTPCGHNFCLKCFQKWVGHGKRTCAKCRRRIPAKMASQPRINSSLVAAIRLAKLSTSMGPGGPLKVYHFVHNQERPDKAYTTERAKKAGKANASSGKIFVTVPPDHFGPIPAENDPIRKRGVLVGECWEDRLECRQWGTHLPHVSGIYGRSRYGAQSVALSGGYIDDEDHGEWFLYTGSGGRDLSGNKRTNKKQSFDQKFEKHNEALRLSCKLGYPVRVVRSHKEKRSSYAPEKGVRYDGVYRIEKCWRKVGIQGFKVCRYLFVRCDNEPAPWTSDEHGDKPRALPVIPELKKAIDMTDRTKSPSWDFDEEESCWKWKKSPPPSRMPVENENPENRKRSRKARRKAQNLSVREKLLKEFSCLICRQVMNSPVTTPCAHNFCKSCLEAAFAGKSLVRERSRGGRTLRVQKNILSCPCCPTDISDFLQDPQVNRELMAVIESLQSKAEGNEAGTNSSSDESSQILENTDVEMKDCISSDLQNSSPKKAAKRPNKRRKIESEALPANEPEGSEAKKLDTGTRGATKKARAPASKRSTSKNGGKGGQPPKTDTGVRTRSRRVQEAGKQG